LEPFLDNATWKILYRPGHTGRKVRGIAKGFLRRLLLLFVVPRYDIVFIHREAAPLGPPVFEWIIAKILRKRIVFDFDDAIWLPNTSENNRLAARLKWHQKTASICRWAWKISAGNKYLLAWGMEQRAWSVLAVFCPKRFLPFLLLAPCPMPHAPCQPPLTRRIFTTG
nr:hypothetical protein [Cytophagales bacterium]